jgi:hypothetical protein
LVGWLVGWLLVGELMVAEKKKGIVYEKLENEMPIAIAQFFF